MPKEITVTLDLKPENIKPQQTQIVIRMNQEQKDAINAVCKKMGVKPSTVARQFLLTLVEHNS